MSIRHPPQALPEHVIHQVLHHLLPPTAPLPPHLIARDLLQRHHFLSIKPNDVESYFCWPAGRSGGASRVIHDLELLSGNQDILDRHNHDIVYNFEPTSANEEDSHDTSPTNHRHHARVRIADHLDLYMLFVWQEADEPGSQGEAGWRYLDTKSIPSPSIDPTPADSPDLVLSTSRSPTELTRPTSPYSSSHAYWDTYGAQSSSQANSPIHRNFGLPDSSFTVEDNEAAYWAAYATVQGSADSTIPSPRLHQHSQYERERGDSSKGDPYGGEFEFNDRERRYGEDGRHAQHDHSNRVDGDHRVVDYLTESQWNESSHQPTYPRADYDNHYDTANPTRRIASALSEQALDGSNDEALARVLCSFVPPHYLSDLDHGIGSPSNSSSSSSRAHAEALKRALFPVLSYQEHQDRESIEEQERSRSRSRSRDFATVPVPTEQFPPANSCEASRMSASEDDIGDAIRGVYKLWISRTSSTPGTDIEFEGRKAAFLEIVSRSLDSV